VKRVILALVFFGARFTYGDVCEQPATAPNEVAVRDLDLGAPRAPCTEHALFVRLRGAVTIDLPDFYGTIGAAAILGLRAPVGPVELSIAARAVSWEFAQDASFKATDLQLGPIALGALLPLGTAGAGRLALAARVLLPYTDTAYGTDTPYAAGELALHGGVTASERLALYGSTALLAWGASSTARAAANLSFGAGLKLGRPFAIHLGIEAQTGWYAFPDLDHLLVRGGLRFTTTRAGRFELAAAVPLAGRERTDAVVGIDWSLGL
jgi:hypothetical protein